MALHKSPNSDFHHLFHLNVDVELLEVGLFQLFRNLGKSMLALALPFHLYVNLQYEIWEICVFYTVWQSAFALIIPFCGSVIQKWGLKHSMAFSTLTSSIFWIMIPILLQGNLLSDITMMLPFLLLRAFGFANFEVANDIFLTHHMNRKKKGKVIAILQITILLASLLAPILGAYITSLYGMEAASYTAVLFFLIGGGILLLTPDEKIKVPYTPKKLAFDTIKKTPKELHIAELGWIFYDTILWIVWPLFLIIVVKDLLSMSILIGISSFLAMILTYFIGREVDNNPEQSRKILLNGAMRGVVINLFRAVSFSPLVVLFVDFLNRINWQSISVTHDNEAYKWLHEKDTYERSHIRWWIIEVGYTIMLLILTPLFYIFDDEPQWLFISLFVFGGICLSGISQISKINQSKN